MNASIQPNIEGALAGHYPIDVLAAAEREAARLYRVASYRDLKQALIEMWTAGHNAGTLEGNRDQKESFAEIVGDESEAKQDEARLFAACRAAVAIAEGGGA